MYRFANATGDFICKALSRAKPSKTARAIGDWVCIAIMIFYVTVAEVIFLIVTFFVFFFAIVSALREAHFVVVSCGHRTSCDLKWRLYKAAFVYKFVNYPSEIRFAKSWSNVIYAYYIKAIKHLLGVSKPRDK